ncbi:hypothetical protein EJ110_NYTH28425 [Nymphaea thermarum]|nr:hypothetical protein EJ110_NYTH28425 [Nymphaea thermarum]
MAEDMVRSHHVKLRKENEGLAEEIAPGELNQAIQVPHLECSPVSEHPPKTAPSVRLGFLVLDGQHENSISGFGHPLCSSDLRPLERGEGLRLTGESLSHRTVRRNRPVTTGIRAQILLNLGKRLESRCRSSRQLAAVEENAMASQYNLRGPKSKEPARPEETSLTHDQGNLEETVNRLVADVATHEEALGFAAETFEGFKEEMKLMQEQIAESVAMNRSLSDLRTNRVDVQHPVKYSGSWDAKAIDNFLFQVDYYLHLHNVVEEDLKIKTATMLLEGDVVAWWRRKMLDIENGDFTISTFDDFRKQLKGYFMPVDAERHAYQLVANLKQIGALRDYIRAYQKVMLDMPMMPEKDKLHWFIIGLRSWAQADVERLNPETLEQAHVAIEHLSDTQLKSYTDTFKSTKKSDHGG